MTTVPTVPHSQDDISRQIDLQERVLDRQLEWIKAVESKISLIVGVSTAMLGAVGVLASKVPIDLQVLLKAALGSMPLLVSLIFCGIAAFPHTAGPAGSMIYFGGICQVAVKAYSAKVNARTETEYLHDLNNQCHRNAQIAAAKYWALNRGLVSLFVGTISWFVACLLL